jgi:hypothetical protein
VTPTESEIITAYDLNAKHDLTAARRASSPADSGWNGTTVADIPIWHMRPGMQVQAHTHAEGWDTVISAPQHDADWRTEHILVRNDNTHQERVLSRPYRSMVFVKAPAYMLSSAYFHATHDSTPHSRTSALQPAAPSRSRAAATTGRTGR